MDNFGQLIEAYLVREIKRLWQLDETSYYDQWHAKASDVPKQFDDGREVYGGETDLRRDVVHLTKYVAHLKNAINDLKADDKRIRPTLVRKDGQPKKILAKHIAAFQKELGQLQMRLREAEKDLEEKRHQLGQVEQHKHGGKKSDSGDMRRFHGKSKQERIGLWGFNKVHPGAHE